MCIFCILFAYYCAFLHITGHILHIIVHILYMKKGMCILYAYYLHIILHILHITVHILHVNFHILHITCCFIFPAWAASGLLNTMDMSLSPQAKVFKVPCPNHIQNPAPRTLAAGPHSSAYNCATLTPPGSPPLAPLSGPLALSPALISPKGAYIYPPRVPSWAGAYARQPPSCPLHLLHPPLHS